MENPAYWTELHWKIHRVGYDMEHTSRAKEITKILQDEGMPGTLEEVIQLIQAHNDEIEEGICGHSLPAKIINYYTK